MRTLSASASFQRHQLITSFCSSAAAHRPPGTPGRTPEFQRKSHRRGLIMKRLRYSDVLLLSVKVHFSVATLPKIHMRIPLVSASGAPFQFFHRSSSFTRHSSDKRLRPRANLFFSTCEEKLRRKRRRRRSRCRVPLLPPAPGSPPGGRFAFH